ncbi:hypothetical protein [Actinomadura rubrisoli]|uniref:Uncharacterized protein n=1 Tax=Actinomadura rubrisoli TaxID=2530368 RepID=A0A4V2YWW7_9ACTN|nr:hypothetical protein [Actinomadura rubrisoli]TDD87137.1 hypothetical protein E1298_16475 [Actinomadura rubrisoli]
MAEATELEVEPFGPRHTPQSGAASHRSPPPAHGHPGRTLARDVEQAAERIAWALDAPISLDPSEAETWERRSGRRRPRQAGRGRGGGHARPARGHHRRAFVPWPRRER